MAGFSTKIEEFWDFALRFGPLFAFSRLSSGQVLEAFIFFRGLNVVAVLTGRKMFVFLILRVSVRVVLGKISVWLSNLV